MGDQTIPEVRDFPHLRLSAIDLTSTIREAFSQSFSFCSKHHISIAATKDYGKVLLHFILINIQRVIAIKTRFPKAFIYFTYQRDPKTKTLWNSIKKPVLASVPSLFDIDTFVEVKNWEDPDLESLLQKKIKGKPNILKWLKKEGLLELSQKGLLVKKWGKLEVS